MLFDIIEPFADYGFNRSHAFGYGFVSYQTAWLKANYPAQYLASLLTSVKDDKDKTAIYLAECRAQGIEVLVPDINVSATDFTAPCRTTDRRMPGMGHPVRSVGHPQRGGGPGGAGHRRAGEQRAFRRLLRLLRPGGSAGAQQAHRRVTHQGAAPSTASVTPGRACAWCSSRSWTGPWPGDGRPSRG